MFVTELIGTFVLVTVILSIKYNYGAKDLPVNGMVVGTTVFAMIATVGASSGAALNPAIGFVQPIFQKIITDSYPNSFLKNGKQQSYSLDAVWVYIFSPALAGCLAGLWQRFTGKITKNANKVL